MAVNTQDFIRWVRGALLGDGDQPCRVINLAHFPDFRTVRTWQIKHDDPPEMLARDMLKDAESHARGLGEVQRYVFQAFFGEANDHSREFTILYNFRVVEEAGDHLTEAPTEKGVLAQTQRLLESTFRTSVGAFSKVLDASGDQLDKAMSENEKLRNENEKLRGENRQMLNDQFKEALILRKVAFKEAQLEKLWSMVIPLAPTLITGGLKMLSGGKMSMPLPPGAPSVIEQKIMGLVGSLKPEQFHSLMSGLEPAQQMLFVDVAKDLKERHEALQKSIAQKGGGEAHPKAPTTAAGDGKTKPAPPEQKAPS